MAFVTSNPFPDMDPKALMRCPRCGGMTPFEVLEMNGGHCDPCDTDEGYDAAYGGNLDYHGVDENLPTRRF